MAESYFSIQNPMLVRQTTVNGTESISNFGSEQAHDCDHNDGDEREDDGILDQTLTFFLGSE